MYTFLKGMTHAKPPGGNYTGCKWCSCCKCCLHIDFDGFFNWCQKKKPEHVPQVVAHTDVETTPTVIEGPKRVDLLAGPTVV